MIDRRGGHGVLVASNVVFAAGLAALAVSTGIVTLAAAWCLLGIGMALGLYDAAFATLTGIFGREARSPITGDHTVCWFCVDHRMASFGASRCGDRLARNMRRLGRPPRRCGVAVRSVVGPAHPRRRAEHEPTAGTWEPRREMVLLAYVFAASWFVTGAMAAHLPALIESLGATAAEAIAAAALVGPAQVAARLAEFFIIAASPSARIGSDRGLSAPDRGRILRRLRRPRRGAVCAASWCGQWASDDRAGDSPATAISDRKRLWGAFRGCSARPRAPLRRWHRFCSASCSTEWGLRFYLFPPVFAYPRSPRSSR